MKAHLMIICISVFGMYSFMNDNDNEGTNFRENINVFRVAKILDKPVMVYIGADYCEVSQRMNEVFQNKELGCFLNEHFICKKFNANNPMHILRANNWGITDVPSYVFFNRKGKIIYTCSGFHNHVQMMIEGQKALDIMQKESQEKQTLKEHIALK